MKPTPLAGIRVLEPGQLLAVPFAARLLADLGAEVIKVESAVRLDTHRQTTYPDNEPGDNFWDRGGTWYSENRGKLGLTLDLRRPESVAIFRDLVQVSDIVMENYTPRVMRGFGLDDASLIAWRPDVIMLSSTGYGHSGPWTNYTAVGPTTEAASGLAAISGYRDGPPAMPDIPFTDYVAAEQSVLALLLALFRRRRTGRGARIDISQTEAQVALTGELVLDAAANPSPAARQGNRHASMAPHGFFPCAGDDRWIALAVSNDREWLGLCAAMGNPVWAAEPRLASTAGRKANEDLLEAKLGAWTRRQDQMELMRLLQVQRVPAGAVLDGRGLVLNEHLRARGFFEWLDHPEGTGIERKPYPGVPWRFSESRRGTSRRAPAHAEHNQSILRDLLGYSEGRIASLRASGALGGPPSAFRRPRPVSLGELQRQGRVLEIDADYRRKTEPPALPNG